MHHYTKLLLLATIAIVLSSCSILKKGELVIMKDATPPPGYNPTYITSTKAFNTADMTSPKLSIAYVDSRQIDSTTKIYMHLVDDNKTYIYGASDKAI